ncbi:hypothetical protein NEMBOFW57_005467 [Staphylotrichum longicolle]|uniref:Uncharacterized protein n=1 Tax=Staphylotrichum longicolle TaxID=669026 RepID=A0AAD4EXK2_9PEZI|nr:hypothetical protein NEMBOFW57_005467 [Staphylotrichum longicolle]
MQPKTLRHAEKKALDGANESQDTLVIAHYLMMDYGVGLTRGTRRVDDIEESQPSSIPETQDARLIRAKWPAEVPPLWDAADGDGVVGDLNLPDTLPLSVEIDSTSRRRKMESTQASTQSNAGRSYDQPAPRFTVPSTMMKMLAFDSTSPTPRAPIRRPPQVKTILAL